MLIISGCGSVQSILDEQDKALLGFLPINANTLHTWTIGNGDVHLEQAFASGEYRITSPTFQSDVKLVLNKFDDIQRYDLEGQTVLVFHGTYGSEMRPAYEAVSFSKRITRSLIPTDKRYVFRPSANRQNLIGAPIHFYGNDPLFLAKDSGHYWPVQYQNLPSDDRAFYAPPSATPTVNYPATIQTEMPVNHERPRNRKYSDPAPVLIKTEVYTPLPEAVATTPTNNKQKPVLRID